MSESKLKGIKMKILLRGNRSVKKVQNWSFDLYDVGFLQGDCCCFDDKC